MGQVSGLTLVFVGKSGNGKSSTGNSILRKEHFKCAFGSTPLTGKAELGRTTFNNRGINIIDTPGFDSDCEIIYNALDESLSIINGVDAFLVVLKFGERFSEQERDTIVMLKSILGENTLKKFGIIVMTNGDTFKRNCSDKEISLTNFCNEETGPFKDLLTECNDRIVVFDNITTLEESKTEQVDKLITMVDNLPNNGSKYTQEMFKQSYTNYRTMSLLTQRMDIANEIYQMITQTLDNVNNEPEENKKIQILKTSLENNKRCIDNLKREDEGLCVLSEIIKMVEQFNKTMIMELDIIKVFKEQNESLGHTKNSLDTKSIQREADLKLKLNRSKEIMQHELKICLEFLSLNEKKLEEKHKQHLKVQADKFYNLLKNANEDLDSNFIKIRRELQQPKRRQCSII